MYHFTDNDQPGTQNIADKDGKGTSSSKYSFFIKASTPGINSKTSITSQDGKGTFATEDQQTYGTFHSEDNKTTVYVDAIGQNTDFTVRNPSGSIIVGDIKDAGDVELIATSNIKIGNVSTNGSVFTSSISEGVDPELVNVAMSFFN